MLDLCKACALSNLEAMRPSLQEFVGWAYQLQIPQTVVILMM